MHDAVRGPKPPVEGHNDRPTERPVPGPATVAVVGLRGLGQLQRAVGNRALIDLVQRSVDGGPLLLQRVPVRARTRAETLFNEEPTATPGQVTSNVYGDASGARFDMSRTDTPAEVVVTVRIRFVNRARNASGGDTGARTVIPANDERRAWAENMCTAAPGMWNGRARLVSQRTPAAAGPATPSAPGTGAGSTATPGRIELPLVFRATPVWDLTSKADTEVAVFGSGTAAGGDQHPIDSGHFYMNQGTNYPFPPEAIYAHEYGHLIGLPDEYSHSNPQMHALLHEIDPATAAARSAAMDRESVRRMVLAALTRPLFDRLSASRGEISAAFSRASGPVWATLSGQMTTALNSPAVAVMLTANLPPMAARLVGQIPLLLRIASGQWNTAFIARRVVASEFAPAALGAMIDRQYNAALMALQGAVDVGGIGMNITVHGNAGITPDGQAVQPPTGVWNAATSGPSAADATAVVDRTVGAAPTGGRVPPVRPSGSILAQLAALPARWSAFASGAPAALSSGTLQSDLLTALTASWVARVTGGGVTPATINDQGALIAAVRSAVESAATATSTNAIRNFLAEQITPVLQSSAATLQTAVGVEVERIMSTPAGALAAQAPADPQLAALANTLAAQLRTEAAAAQAAQAGTTGATPVNPGAGGPGQSVTYGTANMMSDNSTIFRRDQFVELARQFNAAPRLKRAGEADFTAEIT